MTDLTNDSLTSSNPHALLGVVQPEQVPPRVAILEEAKALIIGARQQEYGPPEVNHQRIADLWNVQFAHLLADGKKFTPSTVAMAMLQLKAARAVQSPGHDTLVDLIGYAAIAAELHEKGL